MRARFVCTASAGNNNNERTHALRPATYNLSRRAPSSSTLQSNVAHRSRIRRIRPPPSPPPSKPHATPRRNPSLPPPASTNPPSPTHNERRADHARCTPFTSAHRPATRAPPRKRKSSFSAHSRSSQSVSQSPYRHPRKPGNRLRLGPSGLHTLLHVTVARVLAAVTRSARWKQPPPWGLQ